MPRGTFDLAREVSESSANCHYSNLIEGHNTHPRDIERALAADYSSDPFLFRTGVLGMVGCSAGGSLVSQTTAILIEQGKPTPGALGVYCAGLGAVGSGDSAFFSSLSISNIQAASRQAPATASAAPSTPVAGANARNYYTGVDMKQFIVNPTLDDSMLAKFPPTIFFTATRDFAMSASAYSHWKLLKAGVPSDLMIFEGLYHGFMTNPDFPEAREGYQISAQFFDDHLGR